MSGSSTSQVRASLAPETERSFAVRLMEHLVIPTFVIDHRSRVLVWNKACERLTGVDAAEVLHTADHWRAFYSEQKPCLADLLACGDLHSIKSLYAHWEDFGLSDHGVSLVSRYNMPRIGRELYLAVDAGPIYDDAGALVAVVQTLRDVTAQREANKLLEGLAAKDGLTGLSNRRSFEDALSKEIRRASRNDQTISLLMIDVDCFKLYNDTYGHRRGDECLVAVAQAIKDTLQRPGDLPTRYGGEEFAVILPETDAPGASMVAAQILHAVTDLAIRHDASTCGSHVTLSIGCASGSGSDLDANRLVVAADEALYASKRGGRNQATSVAAEPSCVMF